MTLYNPRIKLKDILFTIFALIHSRAIILTALWFNLELTKAFLVRTYLALIQSVDACRSEFLQKNVPWYLLKNFR